MGRPIAKRLYTLNSAMPGSSHYATSASSPTTTFANNSSGWIVSTRPAPQFSLMDFQTERTANTLGSGVTSSASPNTGAGTGDCFVIGPINGVVLAGEWQITQSVKANTQGGDQDGGLVYRIYTGSVVTGAGAGPIVATFFSSSLYTNLSTTVVQVLSCSFTLPEMNFIRDGYIFIQNQLRVTGAGGGTTRDVNFYFGGNSGSTMLTAPIVNHPLTFTMTPHFDEFEPINWRSPSSGEFFVSVAAVGDDAEMDSTTFWSNGENADGVGWIGGAQWDFFRFVLPQAIPAGATITNATMNLYCRGTAGWLGTDDILIVASRSASAVAPTTAGERPVSAGGSTATGSVMATWSNVSLTTDTSTTSSNFSAVIQDLVDTYGGLASGAGVVLWIREATGAARFSGFELIEHAGTSPARLNITYT